MRLQDLWCACACTLVMEKAIGCRVKAAGVGVLVAVEHLVATLFRGSVVAKVDHSDNIEGLTWCACAGVQRAESGCSGQHRGVRWAVGLKEGCR